MKKKMSRFISALLVFAMVCAMVPAAFAAVTGVAITGAPESAVEIGYTATLTATVSGDEGTSQEVTWTSSDPAIVSVNAGAITALDAGTATITATSTEDTSKSATCTITVNGSVTGYTVNPATLNVVKGTTRADLAVKLPEKVTVAFGKARSAECRVTWNADNFDGTKLGAQTIPAKSVELPAGAVQGDTPLPSITVNVSNAPTIEVTSKPSNLVVKKGSAGKTLSVIATAKAGDGTDLTSRLMYQWKSSDSKNGTYASVSNGTASTFVVPTDTIGIKYYSCVITVTDPVTNAEATETVGPFTVEVCGEYRVKLVSNAETSKAITVGTNPSISATVEKFNDDKGQYETAVSYNDLEWTVTISGGSQYKYAELITSRDKRSATLNTIGTVSASSTTKMTVKATIGSTDYYGEIAFEVKAGSVQNITVPSVGGGATFSASTFMTAVKAATNSTEFDYVMFSTPYYGTLYESSASKNKITTSDECYYNPDKTDIALDGLYFVPDSNAKSPYVNYVAYNEFGGIVAAGTVVINGSAGDITYDTTTNQSVTFDEDDFQKFFAAAYTKGTLDYVDFDVSYDDNLNTRAYGYLYESSSKNADYVDSRTDYYYDATSRQDDLDDIVFTAGTRTSKYTITVPFTAYGTQNNSTRTVSVNGYVTITVNDGKATTIYSTGVSFKGEIYKAMIPDDYTEREVSGYFVEFGTVTGGKLFYDYSSISDAKEVTDKTTFFFDAGKNELDLEDVYFVPEAGATTAKITYTIYNGKTKVDTGSLTFTVIQQTKSNYFSDITESNTGKWSANAIDFMYVNELVTGTAAKTFSPKQTMNRAMLVTILYRVAGKPSVKSVSNPFNDVKSGSYYYDAVLWAYKNNIVTGTSATTFNPNGAVTREQIAAILYRYAGSPKTTGTLTGYTDKNKVSTYATTAMEWAVKNGIITGKSASTLDPAGLGTRAEVAVMLHRYLTK